MSGWQPMHEVLRAESGMLACPETDCIREFTSQRGLDHHLRMGHGRVVAKTPQSPERQAYQREYHKRDSVRAYQREYKRRKRLADPSFGRSEAEKAKRYAATHGDELRLYRKARAAALKVLVRRHGDEYRLLLEVARERIAAQRENVA